VTRGQQADANGPAGPALAAPRSASGPPAVPGPDRAGWYGSGRYDSGPDGSGRYGAGPDGAGPDGAGSDGSGQYDSGPSGSGE
jgi:hypothetical protein